VQNADASKPEVEAQLGRPYVAPPLSIAGINVPLLTPARKRQALVLGLIALVAGFALAAKYGLPVGTSVVTSKSSTQADMPVDKSDSWKWLMLIPVVGIGLGVGVASLCAVRQGKESHVTIGRLPASQSGSCVEGSAADRVKRVRGTPEALPPEVTALGEPEFLHFLNNNPLGSLAGQAPMPRPDQSRYISYPEALVLYEKGEFTIIPWEAIAEFQPSRGFITADGQKFAVDRAVTNWSALHQRLEREIKERVLPAAWRTIQDGGSVVFRPFTQPWNATVDRILSYPDPPLLAPLTIRDAGISHASKTLRWTDMAGPTIVVKKTRVGLVIRKVLVIQAQRGILDWCRIDVGTIPNGDVLLEIVRRVSPAHLLVPEAAKQSPSWPF
jgi:hypothetical protein